MKLELTSTFLKSYHLRFKYIKVNDRLHNNLPWWMDKLVIWFSYLSVLGVCMVTSGLLGKCTLALDRLSSRIGVPGGVFLPSLPGRPLCFAAQLAMSAISNYSRSVCLNMAAVGKIRSWTRVSEWRQGNHLPSITAAESVKNQVAQEVLANRSHCKGGVGAQSPGNWTGWGLQAQELWLKCKALTVPKANVTSK